MNKNKRRKDEGFSFKPTIDGLNYAIEKEHNLIYIMLFITVILGLSIFFKVELYEILILVVTSGITFSLELINTSIESLTDLVTTKNNNLAKIAKDSSAAIISSIIGFVFMITIISTLIIFVPKIINYIGEIV